jgi:adenosylmethionine-8-amino-7-oxononanoate aminotransferase
MVADRAAKASFDREALLTEKVTARALELGLIVYPAAGCGGSDGDAVMLGPPFVITENEMNEAVDLLRRAIDEVCRERPARIP